jgi:hypothetical protein
MDMQWTRMPAGGNARQSASRPAPTPTLGWSVAGGLLCAAAIFSSLTVPAPLVLLATGSVLAVAGFVLAAALLCAGRHMGRNGPVGWDAASALVFFGFAAALLADTGAALTALAELRSR